MKTMFKKAISILLVTMLVCSLFTVTLVTNVGAEEAVPTFDSTTQSQIVNWSGSINSSTPFNAGELPVKDKSAAAYVQYVVTTNADTTASETTQWVAPNIKIASVTYNDAEYALVLRMMSQHGHTLGLYPENDYNADPEYAFWENQVYPEQESQNYSGSYTITAKVEGNSVNLWWGEFDVTTTDAWDLSDLSNLGMTVNGLNVGAGYNWGGYDFTLNATAWTDTSNYKYLRPTFDSATQTQIVSGTHVTGDYAVDPTTWSLEDVKDTNKAVYTTYHDNDANYQTGWHGTTVYMAAAGTDIWAVRLTEDYGICIGRIYDANGQTDGPVSNANYPNGTQTKTPCTITVKTENGKITVWAHDDNATVVLLKDYELSGMTAPAVGVDTFSGGATITATTWVDNDNYKYLRPTFDSATQTQIVSGTHVTGDYAVDPTTWSLEDVKDTNKAVYTTYHDNDANYQTGWHGTTVYMAAAGTDIWAVRLTEDYGICIGRIYDANGQTDGPVSNANYPNGTQTKTPCTITVKTENGKITVWAHDDNATVVLLKDYELSGMTAPAVGVDTFSGGATITATTWVDNDNYAYLLPEFDEDEQIKIIDNYVYPAYNEAPVEQTAYLVDNSAAVYTKYTAIKGDNGTGYYGFSFGFAKNSEGKVLGMRATYDNGYLVGFVNGAENDGSVKGWTTYPDTGSGRIADEVTVVVKTENNKVTVWYNGNLILKNYEFADMAAPFVGVSALDAGTIFNIKTWTENENYGRLGDLNADMKIDVLDLIRMKKISIGYEGSEAFNDAVKAFNSQGTIRALEIAQMRRYLLGLIDELTPTPDEDPVEDTTYGEDTVDAGQIA